MSELISVIVPVYNVDKYLNHCVQTIVEQTYNNLEIILVDDGSTDNSGIICDQWTKKDFRIRVIHKENGGLSDSRNVGLAKASGDYVVFWDSDDWTETTILETAIQCANESKAEIVVWGYSIDFVDENEILKDYEVVQLPQMTVSLGIKAQELLSYKMIGAIGYAWNKLYRRTLIVSNGYSFEKGTSLVEDILFNSDVFCKAKAVSFLSEIGNHYIQRPRLTLGVAYYPNRFPLKCRAAEASKKILLAYGNSIDEINRFIQSKLFISLKSTAHKILRTNKLTDKEKITALNDLFTDQRALSCIKESNLSGAKNKFFAFLAYYKLTHIFLWSSKLMKV